MTLRLLQRGTVVHESAMVYAGTTSMFSGELPAVAAGNYDLQVIAADAEAVNFGMASRRIVLKRP